MVCCGVEHPGCTRPSQAASGARVGLRLHRSFTTPRFRFSTSNRFMSCRRFSCFDRRWFACVTMPRRPSCVVRGRGWPKCGRGCAETGLSWEVEFSREWACASCRASSVVTRAWCRGAGDGSVSALVQSAHMRRAFDVMAVALVAPSGLLEQVKCAV